MKTKAQIVQQLLEDKKIDAEEAVILLMSDREYVPIAHPYPYPVYPAAPFQPYWYLGRWPITMCSGSTSAGPEYYNRPTFTVSVTSDNLQVYSNLWLKTS